MGDLRERISIDPAVCHGKPTIRGLPVGLILDLLDGGSSHEQILSDYPDLERDDIFAALAFAERAEEERIGRPADRDRNR